MDSRLKRRGGVVALALLVIALVATAVVSAAARDDGSSTMEGMQMGTQATQGMTHWSGVSGAAFHSNGTTRAHYLGADQVVWNYARPVETGSPASGSTRWPTRT